MRKRLFVLLGLVATLGACAVMLVGGASAAKPAKFAVCHYPAAGSLNGPKTLWLGSAHAVAKHVANHTVANGHSGNDTAGVCAVP